MLLQSSHLLAALLNAETGARGFLLTGDPDTLAPYTADRPQIPAALDRLAALTADNPAQSPRLAELRRLTAAKLARLDRAVFRSRAGDTAGALAVVRQTGGERLMDAIRATLADFDAEEQRLLRQRQAAAAIAKFRERLLIWALSGFGIALLAAALFSGLSALRAAARARIAAGVAASESRLRIALEGAEAAIWDLDLATSTGTWSDRFFEILGLPRAADGAASPEAWRDCVHTEDAARVMAAYHASLAGNAPFRADYRIHRADTGELRWISAYGRILQNAAGQPARSVGVLLDVTERASADARLAAGEARLRSVLDNIPAAVVLAEAPSGRIVLGNPAVERVFRHKLRATASAQDYPEWEAYTADGSRLAARDYPLARALAGETCNLEIHYACGDGIRRWIAATGTPLRDEQGRITGALVVCTDVDERTRAQLALARAASEFRTLADNVTQFAWMTEPDGAIFWYNQPWYDYTGTTLEQMRGWGWRSVHHPDHLARVEAKFRAAIESGEPWEDLFPLRGADGRFRWFLSRAKPIRDAQGRILRWFGTNTDITEQRETETALLASQARFRAAIAAVEGILWTNNAAGEMTGEQPGWAALTGQTFDEYQGYGWANAVHPEDAQPTIDAWNEAVAATKPFVFEHRVRRHDGVWCRFAIRAIPVQREDGSVLEWVGVHTDVTAQRDAAAVLARSRDELERLVAERTGELAAAQARLAHAQRMEALGQLAGGIAHDFNNVLQAVQGGARMIATRAADTERVRRLAELVAEAANRGAGVTGRLLAFARRADLRAGPVDPAALLNGVREILAHTIGPGIEIHVQAPADLPPLLADRGQLETALINLAANARDAMGGSGTLTLGAARETRDGASGAAPALLAGSYIRLSVADTGTGMAPEVLARASEPFFTTKPQGAGTGLGLAMARGFAEQSGGGLSIESRVGTGTVVRLWFPVGAAAVAAQAPAAAEPAPGCAAQPCVLLVDDEALVREITAELLAEAGFSVTPLAAASDAIAWLEAGEAVDLLLSDLSMPGMDGLALIRRAQELRPGLPAILLTGYATDAAQLAVGGALTGSFTLLRKPVEARVLAARIAALLEAKAPAA